jgi:hypothetical protein
MSNNDDRNSSTGNDGFVWSQRASVVLGFALALALAAAKFAPLLAGPLEWAW